MTGTVAVVTIAAGRHDHLVAQVEGLNRQSQVPELHIVVSMGDAALRDGEVPITSPQWRTVTAFRPVEGAELPLAASRNLAARSAIAAGADVLIFLDVDCIPAPSLVREYVSAVRALEPGSSCWAEEAPTSPALFGGDIAYLRPAPPEGYAADTLADLSTPSPVRPVLRPGEQERASRFELFWSLSFAMSAADFEASGGFCEEYVGYGAEDTDFAQHVRRMGGSLTWVGGATAYHQHHESAIPPVQHLRAIVRNANVFYDRWGWWPMDNWLHAFDTLGLVTRQGPENRWAVTTE